MMRRRGSGREKGRIDELEEPHCAGSLYQTKLSLTRRAVAASKSTIMSLFF